MPAHSTESTTDIIEEGVKSELKFESTISDPELEEMKEAIDVEDIHAKIEKTVVTRN